MKTYLLKIFFEYELYNSGQGLREKPLGYLERRVHRFYQCAEKEDGPLGPLSPLSGFIVVAFEGKATLVGSQSKGSGAKPARRNVSFVPVFVSMSSLHTHKKSNKLSMAVPKNLLFVDQLLV